MRSHLVNVQHRFARKQFYPQGWEPYLARFLELFHKYGYIYKSLDGGTWTSAKETWKLNDAEIIKAIACAHPKYFIGTRAGRTTRYAVLDIDKHSKYHSLSELQKLLTVLADAGLPRCSLFRSSYSDGWHLYIFFDAPVGSATLRKYLVRLFSAKGFEISKGTLEIFPHPGAASLGMGLRLPLQPGWAWLDKSTLDVDFDRAEMSATKALEYFLDALDADANSIRDFENFKDFVSKLETPSDSTPVSNVVPLRKAKVDLSASESSIFVASVFGHLPTGIIADNWCRGRTFHIQGLFGSSQRAEALLCLGHYLFYGDPSRDLAPLGYGYEEEREWALSQFFEQKHNGFSDDINRGRSDAFAQVARAAHWRPQNKKSGNETKFVQEQPVAWKLANEKRRLDARHRIEEAHSDLRKRGGAFTTVELAKAAGCSKRTLYAHADIWRQDYEDLASDFFASSTGEYNAVDDSFVLSSSSPAVLKEDPPGLVAARAVVFDLVSRSKKITRLEDKAERSVSENRENDWHSKVSALTKFSPSDLPVTKLRSHLFLLTSYLTVGKDPSQTGNRFMASSRNVILSAGSRDATS